MKKVKLFRLLMSVLLLFVSLTGSGFSVYAGDEEGKRPAILEGYGYEQMQLIELINAEPYGDAATSHLYTLQEGERVVFYDDVTEEPAVEYNAGDTLVLIDDMETTICFRPADYDASKEYTVSATSFGGDFDFSENLREGEEGSYLLDHVAFGPMPVIEVSVKEESVSQSGFAGGKGTAEDPYLIADYEQLKRIGEQSEEGLYYRLSADITANTSEPDDNSENVWSPVDPKGCHFDGAGHTISNLCILGETVENGQTESSYAALFGKSGIVAELKDVTIRNICFLGNDQYAAALAVSVNEMSGCTIAGNIMKGDGSCTKYMGGLAYEALGKVSTCVYDAKFTCNTGTYIAGIVYKAADVEDCCTAEGSYIGLKASGVVMWGIKMPAGDIAGIVHDVKAPAGGKGIVKGNVNNASLDGCLLDSNDAVGIVYFTEKPDNAAMVLEGNVNNGSIKGKYASGIVNTCTGDIKDCVNNGDMDAYYSAAGIVYHHYEGTIDSCENKGKISSKNTDSSAVDMDYHGAAGIACFMSGSASIKNCINRGKIVAGAPAAGVVGLYSYYYDALMENCANLGEVSGSEAAGIIAAAEGTVFYGNKGEIGPGTINIRDCYNAGIVRLDNTEGESLCGISGIVGYSVDVNIENCFNAGLLDMSITSSQDYYGSPVCGIAACMNNTVINNCYNVGEIKKGKAVAYGIAATSSDDAGKCKIQNTYFRDAAGVKDGVGNTEGKSVNGLSATRLSDKQMCSADSFAGFDFEKIWQIGVNDNYPYPELKNNLYAGEKKGGNEPDGPGPSIDTSVISMAVKGKYNVAELIKMQLTEDKQIAKYSVDNKKIAGVNKAGVVTAKKEGTVIVTAYEKTGKKAYAPVGSVSITVVKPVFKISNKDLTYTGATLDANEWISNLPEEASISWTIPAKKAAIATVDKTSGIVTAGNKNGTVKLTCEITEGGYTVKYNADLKVKLPKPTAKMTIKDGKTKKLTIKNVSKYTEVLWTSGSDVIQIQPTANNYAVKLKAVSSSDPEGAKGEIPVTAVIDGIEYVTYVTIK